jgi:hypothetical protein
MRGLSSPGRATVEFEHDGGGPTTRSLSVEAEVVLGATDSLGRRVGAWRIGWDGRLVTFGSATTVVGEWRARPGGVLPEHREGMARGVYGPLGSDEVAEIAAVGNAEYVFWLLFLNERAQRLARHQVIGFDEPRLTDFADAAGLHYRRYRLDVDLPALRYVNVGDYFPLRGDEITVSRTAHAVTRQDWIRGGARTRSDG